jgi:hypothetical protein
VIGATSGLSFRLFRLGSRHHPRGCFRSPHGQIFVDDLVSELLLADRVGHRQNRPRVTC